jgi:molybdopterin molybdotransferase
MMLTVHEAKNQILHYAASFGIESISLRESLQRVLTENIVADRAYPPFHRSAMDGYAISSQDWQMGRRVFEVKAHIHAGDDQSPTLLSGQCYKIMTGAAVPLDADAVIRIEDAIQEGEKVRFVVETLQVGQNISKMGEDASPSELLVPAGTWVSPTILAGMAVVGKTSVKVQKLPKVAVISTGNEIIPADKVPNEVEIRDSNSYSIEGLLQKYKIPLASKTLVRDDPALIKSAVLNALETSILIISGGVSAGDADFVPHILQDCGVIKIFHKVQIKPGKPLWFGVTPTNGVVFALPGNPVSVQVAFLVFIEPFIRACFGLPQSSHFLLPLLQERKRKIKFDEFFPCQLITEGFTGLMPLKSNGSGDIRATLWADGFALHPPDAEIIPKMEIIPFFPLAF